MRRWFVLVLLLLLAALQTAGAFSFKSDNDFLPAEKVFQLQGWQAQGDAVDAASTVAKGYYVYRRSLQATDASGAPLTLALSAGTAHHDEFFGDTEVYRGQELTLGLPAGTAGPVTLHWQGCADAGICYPPQTMQVNLPAAGAATTAAATGSAGAAASAAPAPGALAADTSAALQLGQLNPVAAVLLFLGFGLLLAFTPCSLPMIPIVSTVVVGSGAGPRRALALSLVYVLAMAATYAVVGVIAGLAGANVQAALQSPWLLGAFAALFLFLALPLFGVFELQLPQSIARRIDAAGRKRAGGHLGGAAALGFLSALLVGPCMTAPLAGALLYIGQSGDAVMGGVALFALGLGMGLPLIAIGVFGARVLPKPGPWMERVRVAFGYVMVAMAIYLLSRFLPPTVTLLLWGVLGLGLAIGLVAWTHAATLQHRLGWTTAFSAALVGFWSVLMLAGAASGGSSPLRPLEHLALAGGTTPATERVQYVPVKTVNDLEARLQQAGARGQWTLVDLYADWCVSCRVNERNVFENPQVVQQLTGLQVLRPDVTQFDAADQALLKHLRAAGPPTMMLIAPDGQEARALRMVGEVSARDFLQVLRTAGATS